jgi:hypothetical protein
MSSPYQQKSKLNYYTEEVFMAGNMLTFMARLIIKVQLSHFSRSKRPDIDVEVSRLSLGIHLIHSKKILMLSFSLSRTSSTSLSRILMTLFIVIVDTDLHLVVMLIFQQRMSLSIAAIIVVLSQRRKHT